MTTRCRWCRQETTGGARTHVCPHGKSCHHDGPWYGQREPCRSCFLSLADAADERDKLAARVVELESKVTEQSRYLLADEERRKLTGDALQAEGLVAAIKTELDELAYLRGVVHGLQTAMRCIADCGIAAMRFVRRYESRKFHELDLVEPQGDDTRYFIWSGRRRP